MMCSIDLFSVMMLEGEGKGEGKGGTGGALQLEE
jgi:hypothetical protein